ncbi:MAG: Dna2/Cas4 domain-containing protein [Chloroflexota bacterium]
MGIWFWFVIGIGLLLAAAVLWLWSRTAQTKSGLPAGSVIYTDTGTWFPNEEPLYADDVQLVGRPDYLVEAADGSVIPVELKSSKAPPEPYEGHILQLAAYCYLVGVNYGQRPSYGIIQYRNRAFAIDYTHELEADLLDVLDDMRAALYEEDVDRDHNDWQRCARCGVRGDCYQRLA